MTGSIPSSLGVRYNRIVNKKKISQKFSFVADKIPSLFSLEHVRHWLCDSLSHVQEKASNFLSTRKWYTGHVISILSSYAWESGNYYYYIYIYSMCMKLYRNRVAHNRSTIFCKSNKTQIGSIENACWPEHITATSNSGAKFISVSSGTFCSHQGGFKIIWTNMWKLCSGRSLILPVFSELTGTTHRTGEKKIN